MAKVYDGHVRFMRKVQVKEYEPVEAEVSLKFQTTDEDDHDAVLAQFGMDARTAVLSMIKGKFEAQGMPTDQAEAVVKAVEQSKPGSEAKVEPKAEAPKSNGDASGMPDEEEAPAAEKPKRTRGPNKKKAEEAASSMPDEDDGPPAGTSPTGVSDMPDDEGEPAATNGSADMPDEGDAGGEDWENAAPETEKLTAADVTAFISKQVSASKITVPDVKSILAKFGGARVGDIDPAKLPTVKAAILADCKA